MNDLTTLVDGFLQDRDYSHHTDESVVLKVDGLDAQGQSVFSVELSSDRLPRGEEVTLELPSYEISEPASDLSVALVSAEYSS